MKNLVSREAYDLDETRHIEIKCAGVETRFNVPEAEKTLLKIKNLIAQGDTE
jgi:hypothetical protein